VLNEILTNAIDQAPALMPRSYQTSVVTVQQPLQLVSPYTTTGNYYTWSVTATDTSFLSYA
jgi:hypothetical protein